jgi:hypothetical protein
LGPLVGRGQKGCEIHTASAVPSWTA